MKELNGKELAEFIMERQAKQVRVLRQASHIIPRLAIVSTTDNPVIQTYVRLKKKYGEDIGVDVDIYDCRQKDIRSLIAELNADDKLHGIIVQLPLSDPSEVTEILNLVDPAKDVDGLGENATLDPATPTAINWLLAGYGIDLKARKIAIIGKGKLVGAPLARMWQNSELDVTIFDKTNSDNLAEDLREYDVIVSATGVAGLIKPEMVKTGAVVVDAGTASEQGKIVGDVSPELRERDDITITPQKGGVGPLTITALFDNVIRAASAKASGTES